MDRALSDPEQAAEERCLRAQDLLDAWDFAGAERILAKLDAPAPFAAWIAYYRAVAVELQGRFDEAEALYESASRLDPEFPRPVRISDDEAWGYLRGIVERFPPDLQAALDNVRIDLVEIPEASIDAGDGNDPLLLGLYFGVPIGDKESVPVALPDSVRIFKRNVERAVTTRAELIEQLRITLLHEVGHHLGWDEDDLADRGLA